MLAPGRFVSHLNPSLDSLKVVRVMAFSLLMLAFAWTGTLSLAPSFGSVLPAQAVSSQVQCCWLKGMVTPSSDCS